MGKDTKQKTGHEGLGNGYITQIERISILTKLVAKHLFDDTSPEIDLLKCLKYAKDLAHLIDELNLLGVDLSAFSQEFISSFPEHWKKRTQFLMIVTRYWPAILREYGKNRALPKQRIHEDFEGRMQHRTAVSSNVHEDLSSGSDVQKIMESQFGKNSNDVISHGDTTFLQNNTSEIKDPTNCNVSIFEANDIIQEVDFVSRIIGQFPQQKIAIIVPNRDIFTLLVNRLNIDNVEYSGPSGAYVEPKDIDEISEHFKEFIDKSDDRFGKLVEEVMGLMPGNPSKESNIRSLSKPPESDLMEGDPARRTGVYLSAHQGDEYQGDEYKYSSTGSTKQKTDYGELGKESITLVTDILHLKHLKFDAVICMSMNEDSWQAFDYNEYWLHQYIRQKIGLPSKKIIKKQMENAFYTIINRIEDVFVVRSKRVNGVNLRKSSILAKFEMICKKSNIELTYITSPINKISNHLNTSHKITIQRQNFIIPDRMSVHGLELLMKNPYGFFVRHSLGITSTTATDDQENIPILFRRLMNSYFTNKDDVTTTLDIIKNLDFFYYQKCMNIIEWLDDQECSNPNIIQAYNIRGSIILKDFGIELYGHLDRADIFEHHASLVFFQAYSPSSTKELLYGDRSSMMSLCLIGMKNGFQEIDVPIKEIKILGIANREPDPLSIKTIEISEEIIDGFEERVYEFFRQYTEADDILCDIDEKGNNKYWHITRMRN
ncbi:MAG: hypothetical protein LBJ92_00555 [Holosporales bacterium]|jgi:hypothetical protein|nr:hypothetical protein [Holosporales bacterium]